MSAGGLIEFLRARLTEDGDVDALHQLRHDLVDPRLLALRYNDHPDFRPEWLGGPQG